MLVFHNCTEVTEPQFVYISGNELAGTAGGCTACSPDRGNVTGEFRAAPLLKTSYRRTPGQVADGDSLIAPAPPLPPLPPPLSPAAEVAAN